MIAGNTDILMLALKKGSLEICDCMYHLRICSNKRHIFLLQLQMHLERESMQCVELSFVKIYFIYSWIS